MQNLNNGMRSQMFWRRNRILICASHFQKHSIIWNRILSTFSKPLKDRLYRKHLTSLSRHSLATSLNKKELLKKQSHQMNFKKKQRWMIFWEKIYKIKEIKTKNKWEGKLGSNRKQLMRMLKIKKQIKRRKRI